MHRMFMNILIWDSERARWVSRVRFATRTSRFLKRQVETRAGRHVRLQQGNYAFLVVFTKSVKLMTFARQDFAALTKQRRSMTHGNLMTPLWALVYTCEIVLGLSIGAFATGSASPTPRSPGRSMVPAVRKIFR